MSFREFAESGLESSSDEQSDYATLEERRKRHRLDGLKVVIIEDAADARQLISRYLNAAGARVFSVSSAEEARTLMKNFDPDAIVSDIGMPEEDGISFIRSLRDSEKNLGKHVPAIALTAFIGNEHRDLTLRAGFEEHLCKPVTSGALIDAILKVVLNNSTALH
jgi:CheY-like chemotaxis protein